MEENMARAPRKKFLSRKYRNVCHASIPTRFFYPGVGLVESPEKIKPAFHESGLTTTVHQLIPQRFLWAIQSTLGISEEMKKPERSANGALKGRGGWLHVAVGGNKITG